jgi:hypothetical protein
MRIVIETIPRHQMRYATVGDWFYRQNEAGQVELAIQVADAPAPEDGFVGPYDPWLIALHELVEARLCAQGGVTQEAVDAFDMAFAGEGEPGDDAAAPYRRQHRQACLIEHMAAQFIGHGPDYGTVA